VEIEQHDPERPLLLARARIERRERGGGASTTVGLKPQFESISDRMLAVGRLSSTTSTGMRLRRARGARSRTREQQRPFRIVLLDLHMPDTDGLTLAARLMQRTDLPDAILVMLSSSDRADDAQRARRSACPRCCASRWCSPNCSTRCCRCSVTRSGKKN